MRQRGRSQENLDRLATYKPVIAQQLRDRMTTHGMANHPLYVTWWGMLQRCENPDQISYPRYGGRDVEVCERWHDVRLFIEDIERDLGPRPDDSH